MMLCLINQKNIPSGCSKDAALFLHRIDLIMKPCKKLSSDWKGMKRWVNCSGN